ncbi:MAG: helix-turn-helix domain-containing protein, partial [Gemmatimonadetes bacterium]|nr:helix-turn-helix domain-containing protein [Gemmatimonadota bacterium]
PAEARIESGPTRERGEDVKIVLPNGPDVLLWLTTSRSFSLKRRAKVTPVLVLRTKSSRERDQLRRRCRSFIDLAGAAYVKTPSFYLDRTDLPPIRMADSHGRGSDPYSDKASLVVRTLLTTPTSRRWSTGDLASHAGVNTSTASRVLRELSRRELVRDERPGQGRKSSIWLPDPEALLEDWTQVYTWEDNRRLRVAAPVGSSRAFISRMKRLLAGEQWALTLQAGASLVAPHAKFDVVHTYVDARDSLETFALHRGWEPTSAGKLYLMSPFYAKSVWRQSRTVRGTPVVDTVQLVLDLWNYPVRGREQASHLVETVLRPIWQSDG